MQKRFLPYIISILITSLLLTSCGNSENVSDTREETINQEAISVVTTVFPIYDWVDEILGENKENIELSMLLSSGVDLHSFQPSVDDMIKIGNADVFIYIGGISDAWVDDALKNSTNPDQKVINLMDVLGENARAEEFIEGMELEEEESEEEGTVYDEHIWLSVKNAKLFVDEISKVLSEVNEEQASIYNQNTLNYIQKLDTLDNSFQEVVDNSPKDTMLFADRFPFLYLFNDYGLSYYAAFNGCSAETEASFETLVFLANKLDELGLKAVITLENSSASSMAQTIIDNSISKDQEILFMDSMQSATLEDSINGVSYISIMEKNLDVLKVALQ